MVYAAGSHFYSYIRSGVLRCRYGVANIFNNACFHDAAPGMDIFRFDDNGKIVEHWDVLQVIGGESKNENGLF